VRNSTAAPTNNDSNKGDPVKIFIFQVAALSWAATQVPEITAAIQSFLNAGFRNAARVEFVAIIGGLHPITKATRFQSFRNLFLNMLLAVIVGETRNSLWNATMIRRRRARGAFTPRAGRSSCERRKVRRTGVPQAAEVEGAPAFEAFWKECGAIKHTARTGRVIQAVIRFVAEAR
jgi:hypothetical protein